MTAQTTSVPGISRAKFILRRVRIAIYVLLIVVLGYYKWRYDLIRLPEGGQSPLAAYAPGSRLIVDVQETEFEVGDAVLYRLEGGYWLMGRVGRPPASAPQQIWDALEAGGLWVQKELPDCPGADSLILGPLAPEQVVGRVCGSVPW